MNPFELYNPTKIYFGEHAISKITQEIIPYSKILLVYGGGSIKKNHVYDQVVEALKGKSFIEFGGVEPNPSFETLSNALEIIKLEKIDFVLAVGGGSVIDGAKWLAAAAKYNGDGWDILKKGIRIHEALPFGTVLTLPATGSEMNSGAVITRKETNEKLGMGGPGLFPKFSILDPMVVKSIPEHQLRNGVVDAFTHVMEQYATYPIGAHLQDRIAESILKTLVQIAPKLIHEPFDLNTASNFVWCCTMALNGLIQKGVPTDWATHMIGHELTALYNIDHAMTLAIIMPNLYQVKFENKKEKLAQFATEVFGILDGSVEEKAQKGISAMVDFYHSIGVKTKLSDYASDIEPTSNFIKERFEERGWVALGEKKDITPDEVAKIVKMSY
jgi:NADP-dependent alcohol dehydrogenase